MNIKSVDLKPNPINSCTHNTKVCFKQQLSTTTITYLGKANRHVWSKDPHGLEDHIL